MAIRPDRVCDATLEYAAQLIEAPSLTDVQGIAARRKQDRERAQFRMEIRRKLRAELAQFIRAMKAQPDLSPEATLKRDA